MRKNAWCSGLAGLVLLSACSPAAESFTPDVPTSVPEVSAIPSPTSTSTTIPSPTSPSTTTAVPTTIIVAESGAAVAGTLPDGTPYNVWVEPPLPMAVEGMSAGVMLDVPDGTSLVIGTTQFRLRSGGQDDVELIDDRYVVPTGGGLVIIDLYEEVLPHLGPDPEDTLREGVRPAAESRLPSLELHPPFRWATDTEIPRQMGVDHGLFVVRRGCDDTMAEACSETRAVQLIRAELVYAGDTVPEWPDGTEVFIESRAPRPVTDEYYLDPGPLEARSGHSVMWAGEEMIVWGGATADTPPNLTDGAAFDPVSDTWRMLPESPLTPGQVNRAVWAGDRMIVVGNEDTAEYRRDTDTWRIIGAGIEPSRSHRLMLWTGESVVVWNSLGLHEFDESTGQWRPLEGPGFGSADPWLTSLHTIDGRLAIADLRAGSCSGRRIAVHTASGWTELPPLSLDTPSSADCSYPHQMAWIGDRVVAWEDEGHPTMALDPGGEWEEIATIPLGGREGPDGPVIMGDRLLVPQWDVGAVFDPGSGRWDQVRLPGYGASADMVWTGSEILMWGGACCFGTPSGPLTNDAWRWWPNDMSGGG